MRPPYRSGRVVRDDRDRHQRAGLAMVRRERAQIDVRERVAVDDEKGSSGSSDSAFRGPPAEPSTGDSKE